MNITDTHHVEPITDTTALFDELAEKRNLQLHKTHQNDPALAIVKDHSLSIARRNSYNTNEDS